MIDLDRSRWHPCTKQHIDGNRGEPVYGTSRFAFGSFQWPGKVRPAGALCESAPEDS